MREHAQANEENRLEEQAWANETEAHLRMRGMLEDEATAKKAAYMKQVQEENKRMAQQKRDRERAWKND